jgi:predicted ATPase
MIKSITFEKYKSFKDKTTLDIKPITILVGPNSSGKSSLAKLFGLLNQSLIQGKKDELFVFNGKNVDLNDFKSISHRNSGKSINIDLSLTSFELPDISEGPWVGGSKLDKLICMIGSNKQTIAYPKILHQLNILFNTLDESESQNNTSHEKKKTEDIGVNIEKEGVGFKVILKDSEVKKLQQLFSDNNKIINDILSQAGEKSLNEKIKDLVDNYALRITTQGLDIDSIQDLFPLNIITGRNNLIDDYDVANIRKLPKLLKEKLKDIWPLFHATDLYNNTYNEAGKVDKNEKLKELNQYLEILHEIISNPSYKKYYGIIVIGALQYINDRVLDYLEELRKKYNDTISWYLRPTIEGNIKGIRYIGPLRSKPKRLYTEDELKYLIFNALPFDHIDNDDLERLQSEISNKLIKLGFQYQFKINKHNIGSEYYSITLKENKSGAEYNYTDVGFGLSQIIPILIAIESNRNIIKHHPMIVIEQPELHLHPKAQAEMANIFYDGLFCSENIFVNRQDTDRIRNNTQFVIETHSEHIIRGFQILVARNKLLPDDIGIYYVDKNKKGDSIVDRITLDEKGFLTKSWPEGFFDQTYKMTKELLFGK